MVEAGLRVTVVAPASSSEPSRTLVSGGVEIVLAPHDQRLMIPRRMRPWLKAAMPIVEARRPDLVHGQGIVTGGVIVAGMSPGVPRVVTARGNARRDTLAAYNGAPGRIRAALRDRMIHRIIDATDVVVDVHPDWRVNLPREPRRLVFIPNIVDEAFFHVDRRPADARVIYCGGTRRIKGYDVLEAGWPAVRRAAPMASLRLVGWPEGAALPPLAGVESVGVLGPEALAAEMSQASLVVIPSRYEVSPILLAEAWASGTPVVATDAGGMASLAPGAARVVRSDDPAALADAIVKSLTASAETAALVATGRARAEQHRTSSVVAAHLSLYEALAGGATGSDG
jgi:glycosyltransferase involved in cell wall biosynthesis